MKFHCITLRNQLQKSYFIQFLWNFHKMMLEIEFLRICPSSSRRRGRKLPRNWKFLWIFWCNESLWCVSRIVLFGSGCCCFKIQASTSSIAVGLKLYRNVGGGDLSLFVCFMVSLALVCLLPHQRVDICRDPNGRGTLHMCVSYCVVWVGLLLLQDSSKHFQHSSRA